MADAISEATGTISGYLPEFGSIGMSVGWFITIIVGAVLFLAFVGVLTFMFVNKLKYKYKIVIFEKVNGQYEPTRQDRAMEVPLSSGGDLILFLKKNKKYVPMPEIQTGRRTFWYGIREDGEWINIGIGDLDKESKRLGVRFLHKEARFARTQIQKGLKDRYGEGFMEFLKQYGLVIFGIAYIAIIGVMLWLLFDKWIEGLNAVPKILEQLGVVLDRADSILLKLDNVCTGGGGIY